MEVKMQKLLIAFFTQLVMLTSLYATDSAKSVKSDLLRAIHHNNSNEVRAIVATQKPVIAADPVLTRMVDAYFLDEAHALEELKAKARQKREEEARELKAAIAAKEAEIEAARQKALEAAAMHMEERQMEPKPKVKKHVETTPQKPAKKVTSAKPRKEVRIVKPKVKSSAGKKPAKVTNKKIHMSKVDIAGKWKAAKNKKEVTFKAYDDHTFVLEERSESGTLRLDGTYRQNGEQLLLDIQKITYNVRSREAAVQRIYHLKAISSKRLILLDQKGEVAYSFSR